MIEESFKLKSCIKFFWKRIIIIPYTIANKIALWKADWIYSFVSSLLLAPRLCPTKAWEPILGILTSPFAKYIKLPDTPILATAPEPKYPIHNISTRL